MSPSQFAVTTALIIAASSSGQGSGDVPFWVFGTLLGELVGTLGFFLWIWWRGDI